MPSRFKTVIGVAAFIFFLLSQPASVHATTWRGFEGLGGIVTSDPTSDPSCSFVRTGQALCVVRAGNSSSSNYELLFTKLTTPPGQGADATWSPLQSPGAITAFSNPSCTALLFGQVLCAVVGRRGVLHVNQFDGNTDTWNGFQNLGGRAISDPSCAAAAVTGSSGPIICAVIGPDSALCVNVFDGSAWSGFQRLGGVAFSNPSCTFLQGIGGVGFAGLCAVVGRDGALLVNSFDGSAWSGFQSLGGIAISNPSCTYLPYEDPSAPFVVKIDAICAVVGADSALHVNRLSSIDGTWSGFQPLGGTIISDPSCTGAGVAGRGALCAVRRADSALYVNESSLDGNTWGGFQLVGGLVTSDPSCAPRFLSAAVGPNGFVCGVRGADSGLHVNVAIGP